MVETLPAGFSYVTSSLSASHGDGQVLTFTLIGETSFTYTVTASDTEGDYSFTGILSDIDKNEVDVGGDADITVVVRIHDGGQAVLLKLVGGPGRRLHGDHRGAGYGSMAGGWWKCCPTGSPM